MQFQPGDDALAWALERAKEIKPVLIIVDPWRNHLAGDENDATETLKALRQISHLRDVSGAAVILVHHLNASGGQAGSRAFRTRLDMLIEGTDAKTPKYTARGRTIRQADPIGRPFAIDVAHEHDDDESRAATRVTVRFKDGAAVNGGYLASEKADPSTRKAAARREAVVAYVRGLKRPETRTQVARGAKGRDADLVLTIRELLASGALVERDGKLHPPGGAS